MIHHNACPLCLSDKIGPALTCTDHFVSGKDFRIFRCSSCDFSFTQDYPEEHEIGGYYESEDYISHSDTSKGFTNKLYRIARGIMLRRKKDLVVNVTGIRAGRLLDIGSGTGYFASTMKSAGWQVKGIEINQKAREFSASHFGIDTAGPESVATLETAGFDCITLWHVLEHFHDPFTYISEIYRLLKPGAFCIIALPNSGSYDSAYYNKFWAAWDVPRHLWHFNPDTFGSFSRNAGFKSEKIRTLPLDVFYISIKSEEYRGSKTPLIKGITIASWFALLSLFNKRKTSSIIYVLRKL
jgi:SAM-dependent methyltransferase